LPNNSCKSLENISHGHDPCHMTAPTQPLARTLHRPDLVHRSFPGTKVKTCEGYEILFYCKLTSEPATASHMLLDLGTKLQLCCS
jgi:hypothetical protein